MCPFPIFFEVSVKRETKYQSDLIKKLKFLFPGCVVIRNDPNQIQGIPDILILYRDKWAALEVKRSESERRQPNQEYYVEEFGKMSYASFIYPENEERVLGELQRSFSS
jgi:hypothetical protein